jgi:enoyl-CoA hydratase
MKAEFRIVSRVLLGHDFYEGVRAVIIDKDNQPHWRSNRLEDVSTAEVDRHFAAIAEELVLA